jgi:putative ABC transport system permease protein
LIIAIGITALVGILTAIEAVKSKITDEFSMLGSNTFTVQQKNASFRGGRSGTQEKSYPPISFHEAMSFEEQYNFDAKVSVSSVAAGMATVKYRGEKTNPNIRVIGGDKEYLSLSGYSLEAGRNFSTSELSSGSNTVILGADIVTDLFNNSAEGAVGKAVHIGSYRYQVIGVLKSKGNSMGMQSDRQVVVPVRNVKKVFATPNTSYTVNVSVEDASKLQDAISEAMGLLRIVRQDPIGTDESFEIRKSDSLVNSVIGAISSVTIIATIIGVITLLGAGIGLMNIMLVSVTERTREIGVRKALGASDKTIRQQFLIESIVIGQIGGFFGLIFGLIVGNVVAIIIEAGFTIPWMWLLGGILLCFIVGVVSGYYPAKKAAQLDPINALRYE